MTRYTPLFMGAAVNDAPIEYSMLDLRGIVSALVVGEGVCKAPDLQVTARAGGANRSVDIAGGWWVVQGETQPRQHKYLSESDAVENRTAPAAPPAGVSRHHLVYAQVRDRKNDGGGNYDWVIDILPSLTGTGPTTSAQAKAALDGAGVKSAIPLAKLADSSTTAAFSAANNNIVDLRPFATAINGAATDYKGFKSGTTDASAYIWLPHSLGRKPSGCVATFSHPAPANGSQAIAVTVDMTTATATQVRARVWWPQPYFVWVNQPANISYIVW